MTTQRRHSRGLVATIAAALLLAGCTAGDWREESPPAAGVPANIGPVKVRGLLLVSDDVGSAVLLGGIVPGTADSLREVQVVPVSADGLQGPPISMTPALASPAKALTQLSLPLADPGIKPGLTAQVTLRFAEAGETSLTVPVLANTHPDFRDAWAKAQE